MPPRARRSTRLTYTFTAPDRQFRCELQCGRCTATTTTGGQCSKRTCVGVPLCWMHLLRDGHLRIKTSTVPGANKGLFAVKRGAGRDGVVFRRGDLITRYHGERLSEAQVDARYGESNAYTAPYAVHVVDDLFENGACVRGVGSMVNHARGARANAKLDVGRGRESVLRATKVIRNGQEIFIDYGSDYRLDEPVSSRTARRAAPR